MSELHSPHPARTGGGGSFDHGGLLTNGVAHKKSQYEAHTLRYLSMLYENMNDKLKCGEGLISKP